MNPSVKMFQPFTVLGRDLPRNGCQCTGK